MAETWVLNTRIDSTISETFSASFISAGNSYSQIEINSMFSQTWISYDSTSVYGNGSWTDEAYRTVVFDTAPSGYLLVWLQDNGTKQSEPEPTIPKNACLIDGIGYSTKQGKVLIDGTAYTVKKGRTLIDGTGYDIKLNSMCTIVFSGSAGQLVYAQINGVKYTGSSGTIEVEAGTICTLVADSGTKRFAIIVNGVTVSNKSGKTSYAYTIDSDCTIAFAMSKITVTTQ